MFRIDWQKWRGYALVMALAIAGTVALMPASRWWRNPRRSRVRCLISPTWSNRSVPAVVQHPHAEKARAGAQGGGQMDEEMQEFFRRFFGVPMPNVPRQRPSPAEAARKSSRAAWARASS
jgi:serine protease Do